jgi:hypothetical protein
MPANTPASWLDSFHSLLLAGVMWRIHKSQAMPGDSSESMKALVLSLKIVASVFIFIALVAFGSDFLPVDGISFGGRDQKMVSTDSSKSYLQMVQIQYFLVPYFYSPRLHYLSQLAY